MRTAKMVLKAAGEKKQIFYKRAMIQPIDFSAAQMKVREGIISAKGWRKTAITLVIYIQ